MPARVRVHPRAWLALMAAAALVAGCGGDPPKKAPKPPKEAGSGAGGKAAKADATEPPPKPEPARSKSGKTPHELINLIGDSYKQMDAGASPEELARSEAERVGWVAETIAIGGGALRDVLDALKHPVPEVREWACVILGELGKADAAEALLALALDDRDRNLGVHACEALGRLPGIAGAMERLKPRLTVAPFQKGHPLSEAQAGLLRNAAAEALTRTGSKDGIPALIDAIDGASAEVRRDALVRLRRLTAQVFPTTVDGPADERARSVTQWRQWWDGAKGLFKPTPSEAAQIHQVYAAAKQ
jgi:hypothetical protein